MYPIESSQKRHKLIGRIAVFKHSDLQTEHKFHAQFIQVVSLLPWERTPHDKFLNGVILLTYNSDFTLRRKQQPI